MVNLGLRLLLLLVQVGRRAAGLRRFPVRGMRRMSVAPGPSSGFARWVIMITDARSALRIVGLDILLYLIRYISGVVGVLSLPETIVQLRRMSLELDLRNSRGPAISGRVLVNPRPVGAIAAALLLALCAGCGSSQSGRASIDNRPIPAHSSSAARSAGGDRQHEARMLADVLKKKPDHVPVLLRLAGLAQEAGKPGEAEKYLSEVLKLEPGNVPARLDLGRIQFETGRAPEAIRTTEAILRDQPDNPDALYNLGAIYGNLGRKEQAIEYWSRLQAVSPRSESGQRARQMMAELQRPTP